MMSLPITCRSAGQYRRKAAEEVIKSNKAKDGAEGYAMQYHALREILDAI